MSYLEFAARLFLGLVCAVAAIGKVSSRRRGREFARFLTHLGVPKRWAAPAATGVVAAEAGVAALLLSPGTALVGLVAAAGLFTALTIGVGRVVLRRELTPRCLCFGRLGQPLGPSHVIRNATLAGLATLAAVLVAVVPDASTTALNAPGLMLASLGAVLATMLVVAWDDLAVLFTATPLTARPSVSEGRNGVRR